MLGLRVFALTGAGLAVLGVAVLMPAAKALFAAHMVQHLLLIVFAAPLLVMGGIRLRLGAALAWILFVGIFLFWHWSVAFQWAALHPVGEMVELMTILAAATAFWTSVLATNVLSDGSRALMVVTAAIVTDLPGVIMLFAPTVICAMPAENAARFGLTPLQDQQIAGLLMWVPANLVFFCVATWLFARWIGAGGRRALNS